MVNKNLCPRCLTNPGCGAVLCYTCDFERNLARVESASFDSSKNLLTVSWIDKAGNKGSTTGDRRSDHMNSLLARYRCDNPLPY